MPLSDRLVGDLYYSITLGGIGQVSWFMVSQMWHLLALALSIPNLQVRAGLC